MLDFLSAISVGSGSAEAGAAHADDGREVGEQVEALADGLPGRFPVQFPADLAQRPVGLHEDGAGAVVGRGGAIDRGAEVDARLDCPDRRRLAPDGGGSRAQISGCSRRSRSTSAAAATVRPGRLSDA